MRRTYEEVCLSAFFYREPNRKFHLKRERVYKELSSLLSKFLEEKNINMNVYTYIHLHLFIYSYGYQVRDTCTHTETEI